MNGYITLLTLVLMGAYGVLSWHVMQHFRRPASAVPLRNARREHSLLGALLLVHALAVMSPFIQGAGVSFGVGHSLALMAWLMLVIYWTCRFFYRVEGLQLFMMPLAFLTLGFSLLFPGSHVVHDAGNPAFLLHILVSVLAYALFAIAALLAILMLWLERALHARSVSPLGAHLPPLLSLETMMFQVITVGFVLLSISLLSGFAFSEAVFGRAVALTHKTVFSVVSWALFGLLLGGRRVYGWRGRVAIRWALAGFVTLALAYIGSKVVLELILHR